MTDNSKTDGNNSRSFRDAYGLLQRHAETLRDQAEPNIDDLLTIVTESVQAYQVCKERIDAVEAALKVALDGVAAPGQPGTASPARSRATKPSSGGSTPLTEEAADDDIPF